MINEALNLQEVEFIVTDFLNKEFDIQELPEIKMNGRLGRATLGRFRCTNLKSKNCKTTIEIATKLEHWSFSENKKYGYSRLQGNISTVLHECVHYALYFKEMDFHDGDVTFELALKSRAIKSNYNREELKRKWMKNQPKAWKNILGAYDEMLVKDFKKHYEDIILAKRQEAKEVELQVAANTKPKKRAGCKGAKTVVIIDGIKIEKASKSEMQRYIRQEFGLPADGYWFMEDELPYKHRARVSYVEFDGQVIYQGQ